MMQSPVEAIKSKLAIVEVVGSYVKLEKAGVNYKARCPFHNEKTPSFFVSPGRETYHCFGCGKGGDIFSFVEDVEGVEFREALKMLAERAGVVLDNGTATEVTRTSRLRKALEEATSFYGAELRKAAKASDYLKGRELTSETIAQFRIGFAPEGWRNLSDHLKKKGIGEVDAEAAGLLIKGDKGYYDRFRGRIMFPFLDYSGRVIGFSGRLLPGSPDEATSGKYINSPETPLFSKSKVFYGLSEAKLAIRQENKMLLVEGQFDVVLSHQAGTKNVVGVSGTALTAEHIELIRRMADELTLVLDGDEAGFRASERSVRMALSGGLFVRVIPLPEGKDPADCAQDKEEWLRIQKGEQPYFQYALGVLRQKDKDARTLQKNVRDYLYPTLADMYNEIEKDAALQEISSIVGSSGDAVREDFKKWQKTQAQGSGNLPSAAKETLPPVQAAGVAMVLGRLWGISLAFPACDSRGEMKEILGQWFDHYKSKFEGEAREDLIFQAESFYPEGKGVESETRTLLDRLTLEVKKEHFARAMEKLRAAERAGDQRAVEEWLEKCQNISKEIANLGKK